MSIFHNQTLKIMDKTPIIYAFIYSKIKERNRGGIIRTHDLKSIILLAYKLVPKCFCYDVIKDMEDMNLIKRINHMKYQILKNNCERRLKKFIW